MPHGSRNSIVIVAIRDRPVVTDELIKSLLGDRSTPIVPGVRSMIRHWRLTIGRRPH